MLLLRALPRHRSPGRLPCVRRDPAALPEAHEAIDRPSLLLHRIVDGLVDSFFPILADFDDRIDELENAIFLHADDRQLQEIFRMKRLLVGMRKAISPQRDAFAGLMGGVAELPGLAEGDERYFRDVYDHLIRISDLIDSYRDLLSRAMNVYLSTVSNRLNGVTKQLAVIATTFLTFLADRPLRPEFQLSGQEHRRLGDVRRSRRRDRARHPPDPARLLQAARLVLR